MEQAPGTTVAVVGRAPLALLRPIATPKDIMGAQNETRAMIKETLVSGRDYGAVPGTDKKTLLKPGAERVSMAFGCVPRFKIVEKEIDHDRAVPWLKAKWTTATKPQNWQEVKAQGLGRNRQFDGVWVWQEKTEERGQSLGLYRYVIECELVHRESGAVVGQCIASCSSMEAKYIDRPRDSENTVVKMAQKRAFVGANLVAFGLSDEFTQDIEDAEGVEIAPAGPEDEQRAGPTPAGSPTATGRTTTPGIDERAPLDEPSCPKCGGKMWDNRLSKNNPKAPDYKCRSRSCDGVVWPGQGGPKPPAASEAQREQIDQLLPTAKLRADHRERITAKLGDREEPLNAKEADELIQKLKEKQPTASDKAADALKQQRDDQPAAVGADHNTQGGEGLPF